MQTKRQTERVLAARHSADLEALGKQSRLLKREIKSMQGKDWVVECARLESMLQQAYTIVKHVEAQREESIMQQEDMRAKIIELDAALEVELGAAGEEKKRTVAAEKRLQVRSSSPRGGDAPLLRHSNRSPLSWLRLVWQRCEDEVSRFHERCMVLEEQLMAAEKRLTDQKVETGRSEAQLRRVFQHGFDRIRKQVRPAAASSPSPSPPCPPRHPASPPCSPPRPPAVAALFLIRRRLLAADCPRRWWPQELKRRLQTWGRATTAQIAMRQRAELKDLRDRPLPAPVVIGGDLEAAVEKLEEENSLLRDRCVRTSPAQQPLPFVDTFHSLGADRSCDWSQVRRARGAAVGGSGGARAGSGGRGRPDDLDHGDRDDPGPAGPATPGDRDADDPAAALTSPGAALASPGPGPGPGPVRATGRAAQAVDAR